MENAELKPPKRRTNKMEVHRAVQVMKDRLAAGAQCKVAAIDSGMNADAAYTAFKRIVGMTMRQYREAHHDNHS
jgi:methylphosphotriester-DNA--protein-cysteine methyltransferase